MKFCSEKGQSLVEFTLSALLLVTVLFAIIQYGFLFATYITGRNASAIGAREYAIINASNRKASTNDVVTVAKAAIQPMLDPNLASVTLGSTNVTGSPA